MFSHFIALRGPEGCLNEVRYFFFLFMEGCIWLLINFFHLHDFLGEIYFSMVFWDTSGNSSESSLEQIL